MHCSDRLRDHVFLSISPPLSLTLPPPPCSPSACCCTPPLLSLSASLAIPSCNQHHVPDRPDPALSPPQPTTVLTAPPASPPPPEDSIGGGRRCWEAPAPLTPNRFPTTPLTGGLLYCVHSTETCPNPSLFPTPIIKSSITQKQNHFSVYCQSVGGLASLHAIVFSEGRESGLTGQG